MNFIFNRYLFNSSWGKMRWRIWVHYPRQYERSPWRSLLQKSQISGVRIWMRLLIIQPCCFLLRSSDGKSNNVLWMQWAEKCENHRRDVGKIERPIVSFDCISDFDINLILNSVVVPTNKKNSAWLNRVGQYKIGLWFFWILVIF